MAKLLRLSALLLLGSCATTPPSGVMRPRPGDPLTRLGDEISICGRLYHTGARVVLWNDRGGYDAYRLHRHFEPETVAPEAAPDRIARYGSHRRGLDPQIAERVTMEGWTVDDLRASVTQVVVHYDAAGSAERCFRILHDYRGLSSHFLLDTDGTVYQTLDLKERAWHAGIANDRSVGIEIANIGAYPDRKAVEEWYAEHPAIPARPGPIRGEIQGGLLWQNDLTDEQYEALIRLVAAVCRVLDVPADAPRGEDGGVTRGILADEDAIREYRGILGHYHVSKSKVDPGPAFDWERFLGGVRRSLAEGDDR